MTLASRWMTAQLGALSTISPNAPQRSLHLISRTCNDSNGQLKGHSRPRPQDKINYHIVSLVSPELQAFLLQVLHHILLHGPPPGVVHS